MPARDVRPPVALAPRRRPSLARAFWLWYVAVGGGLLFLPLAMRAAGVTAPYVFFKGWIVVTPLYLLFASGLVWVRAREARPLPRILSRVLVLLVILAIASLLVTPHDGAQP